MPLTKIECDCATCPPGKPHTRLADEKGMYLEVTASGGRYWRLKYRHACKEKRLALGVYPDVSLAQARKDRDKARDTLAAGNDSAQIKRNVKAARELGNANTFEQVARQRRGAVAMPAATPTPTAPAPATPPARPVQRCCLSA